MSGDTDDFSGIDEDAMRDPGRMDLLAGILLVVVVLGASALLVWWIFGIRLDWTGYD